MKIQTQVKRDNRPNSIERDDFSSKVDERGVSNIHGVKTTLKSPQSKTGQTPLAGGKGNRRKRKKRQAKKNAVENETTVAKQPVHSNYNNDLNNSKNQKYTSAKADSDGSAAIEMVQTVHTAGSAAVHIGGTLRTAVKGAANGAGEVKTFVQHGVNIGSAKDVGRIATAVNSTVANAARSTGQQMLRTKIDKSNAADTGAETIKQGLTELRYADNARKALLNTSRTLVNTGKNLVPKSKHVNKRVIRRNAKKASKKAASEMRKLITSKAGLIVLGAAAFLLILVLFVNSAVTVICATVSSLFSWMAPPEDAPDKTESDMVNDYRAAVIKYIDTKQKEINDFVDGFVVDRKKYPPYSEITELNQYGNKKITVDNYDAILAILSVKKYREMEASTDDEDDIQSMELKFTPQEIAETVERFYTFEYHYTYGNCSGRNCKKSVTTIVHNEGEENEWTETRTTYYCDVNHQWLHGKVTNIPLEEVLASYGFTDEEWELYEMYVEQINSM